MSERRGTDGGTERDVWWLSSPEAAQRWRSQINVGQPSNRALHRPKYRRHKSRLHRQACPNQNKPEFEAWAAEIGLYCVGDSGAHFLVWYNLTSISDWFIWNKSSSVSLVFSDIIHQILTKSVAGTSWATLWVTPPTSCCTAKCAPQPNSQRLHSSHFELNVQLLLGYLSLTLSQSKAVLLLSQVFTVLWQASTRPKCYTVQPLQHLHCSVTWLLQLVSVGNMMHSKRCESEEASTSWEDSSHRNLTHPLIFIGRKCV